MSSLERQLQKVTIATIRAREKAKIDLISYFRSESLIPKKTHRLVESAVNNLLTYGLGSEFELDIVLSEIASVVVCLTSDNFSVMTASRARKELSFKERNIR